MFVAKRVGAGTSAPWYKVGWEREKSEREGQRERGGGRNKGIEERGERNTRLDKGRRKEGEGDNEGREGAKQKFRQNNKTAKRSGRENKVTIYI